MIGRVGQCDLIDIEQTMMQFRGPDGPYIQDRADQRGQDHHNGDRGNGQDRHTVPPDKLPGPIAQRLRPGDQGRPLEIVVNVVGKFGSRPVAPGTVFTQRHQGDPL